MTLRVEYSPSDDARLVPADKETIATSDEFGRHIQETVDTLDAFFKPTTTCDRWHVPFGRFGDDTLTVLTEQSSDSTSLALGFRASETRGSFYASTSSGSDHWRGNGDSRYDDESVARLLSSNWPSFTIDNTTVRALEAKGPRASFEDFTTLIRDTTLTHGAEQSSTHTFSHQWKWDDHGKDAFGITTATIDRVNGQKQAYRLEVTLPHQYNDSNPANVTCIARFDEAFGTTYDINIDDPALAKLHISLLDMIQLMDMKLQSLMEAKVTDASDSLV